MSNLLRASLGFKGEQGDSAYQIAVKNGFNGTESQWLATLGTSSHFTEDKTLYVTTAANEKVINLPSSYLGSDFSTVDLYTSGIRLNPNAYTVNDTTKKITLTNPIEKIGTEVEIVITTLSTNNLPIVDTVTNSSNDNVPGTKAVYDFVKPVSNKANSNETKVNNLTPRVTALETNMATKFNSNNISTLTGSIADITAGGTVSKDITYPTGFTKANTIIISKMVSSNNVYYDVVDLEETQNGFPTINMIALTDSAIRVWMKNTSTSTVRTGYYKITLLKKD